MKIIVYYKTGCPWATEVMNYLDEEGIRYEERDVTINPEYLAEVKEKSGQSKSPTLDIDGKILADVDADQVADYLESVGVE